MKIKTTIRGGLTAIRMTTTLRGCGGGGGFPILLAKTTVVK